MSASSPSTESGEPKPGSDAGGTTQTSAGTKRRRKGWWWRKIRGNIPGFLFASLLAVVTVIVIPDVKVHLDPPNQGMSLSTVCIASGVRRSDWFDDDRIDHPGTTGLVATVALRATGFHNKEFKVEPDVLEARNGASPPIQLPKDYDIDFREIKGQAETVQRTAAVWQSLPTQPGHYVVRITVYNAGNKTERWATAYSPVFTEDKGGQIRLPALCSR